MKPMDAMELAFAWGFGIVFGVGFAVWLLAVFFGINLLEIFRRQDD
jgi:hypothetical protein